MVTDYLSLAVPGDGNNITPPSYIPTGGLTKFATIITNAISLGIFAVTTVALLFLLWGSIQWILSGGDKAKVQGARNRITYAIIGLIFSFLSFTIIKFIGYLFNINTNILDIHGV